MPANTDPLDYYAVLEIGSTATQAEIRNAYKKAALKHHPDRVPEGSPERPKRTKKFQQINDAYYTLSDERRRREYDEARKFGMPGGDFTTFSAEDPDEEEIHGQGTSSNRAQEFPWSSFFRRDQKPTEAQEEQFSNQQFGSAFEEMLREEGMAEGQEARPTGKFWSIVGGLSGGAMGFIVANFSGAVAGAVAGNRLGAVRDAKGKSVYAVFQELPADDRAKLLGELASKVFAHAVGS